VMAITDLNLVLRLRMRGFIPPYNVMVLCLVQQRDYFTSIFYCDVMQFCGCSRMKSG